MPKFRFHSISWELIDRLSPNFIYAIILTRSKLWSSNNIFPTFCTRVMAIYLWQNFISTQYLENKETEFHQILYMHSYWQDLAWDCYTLFFAHLYKSYGPWFIPEFHFRSISWEQMDRISPNFIYAFILTRSSLGLLQVIFRSFVPE